MCTSILRIICLILIARNLATADLGLYSRCKTVENESGICIEVRNCSTVIDAIMASQSFRPTVCSQQNKTVCCPIRSSLSDTVAANRTVETTASTIETTTSTIATNSAVESRISVEEEQPSRVSVERISERKCREYAQKTIRTIKIAPTLIGGIIHEIKVDKCKHKAVGLVVGGTDAKPFEFPHQGLVGYGKRSDLKWKCGCTLLSPRFVLTAAHCLEFPTKIKILTPIAVKLGSINRFRDDEKTFIVDVEEIFKYEHYIQNKTLVIGDLALLKLAEEVPINEFILPICLPTKQHEDEKAIVTGFGVTEDRVEARNLMKVTLERFSHSECQELWKNKTIDSQAMLCYGHHTEEKDSCKGDSGGPLLVYNNDKISCTYTQIGIVSFGLRQCGTIGFPGVYVNVYNYIDWIEGIVWKDEM